MKKYTVCHNEHGRIVDKWLTKRKYDQAIIPRMPITPTYQSTADTVTITSLQRTSSYTEEDVFKYHNEEVVGHLWWKKTLYHYWQIN